MVVLIIHPGRFLRLTWWSHYWCVLNQITCCISCYKSPQNPKRIKDFYLNGKHQVILGDRVGRISLPPWLSRDNMLSIVSNRKKIIFCCGHTGEAEAWKEVLDSFRTEYFPWRSAVTNRIIKNLHKLPEEALNQYNQSLYEHGRFKRPGELLAHHFKHLGIDDNFDDFEQLCFCKNAKPAAEEQQLEEICSESYMVPNYAQAQFNNMALAPYYGHPQMTMPYFQLGKTFRKIVFQQF
ncbi:hypothetical protein HELRODRAFT_167962 [Helobdella robusta]|uniref:Uncharacterized protein n=1 Tax=Helobdella robusta TaxID=6412 RepID=T1F003_HELRO|nr:hypothetical protein HELRODRAFT_167962 [Helobdella robusta]ESO10103.1 hypothetical protein HELRODRAFT_167962 [Helobdella robusta]